MRKRCSCAFLGSQVDGTEIKKIGIRVVAVDFEDFGNEPSARPAFDVDDDVEGIGNICFDRANAKVRPETTIATRDNPRAMVLVKACCKTLTAFSHGEFAWANAGLARARPISEMATQRAMA
jgi:hypothetical protein